MKKNLVFILAIFTVTAVLAFHVSAETVVGKTDGVTDFDPTTTDGQNINVKVEDVTHKYAVDVTFSLADLTLGGTITWNVNTMKYDIADTSATDTTRTITISNRSDLPVYAYATMTDADPDDFVIISADKDSATNKLTVEKAIPGVGGSNGTATEGNITVSIASNNWASAADYYGNKRLENMTQDTFTIASVTVTISKD